MNLWLVLIHEPLAGFKSWTFGWFLFLYLLLVYLHEPLDSFHSCNFGWFPFLNLKFWTLSWLCHLHINVNQGEILLSKILAHTPPSHSHTNTHPSLTQRHTTPSHSHTTTHYSFTFTYNHTLLPHIHTKPHTTPSHTHYNTHTPFTPQTPLFQIHTRQ